MKGSIGVAWVGSRRVIHLVSDSGVGSVRRTRARRHAGNALGLAAGRCRPRHADDRRAPAAVRHRLRRRVPAPDRARLALPDEHGSAAIQERGSRPSAP